MEFPLSVWEKHASVTVERAWCGLFGGNLCAGLRLIPSSTQGDSSMANQNQNPGQQNQKPGQQQQQGGGQKPGQQQQQDPSRQGQAGQKPEK